MPGERKTDHAIVVGLARLAAMNLLLPTPRPYVIRKADTKDSTPILHKTKGWRGVKKKHRAKFKRRGRKS